MNKIFAWSDLTDSDAVPFFVWISRKTHTVWREIHAWLHYSWKIALFTFLCQFWFYFFFFAWNVEFCPCLCFIFMLIFRALFFCESFRLVWISKFFVIEFCSAWGALQLEFIRHAELFWWALLIGNLHSNVIRTGLACSRGQHVYTNSNRSHLKWITFCSFLLR